jgi:colicin import membrane protein
MGEVTDLIELPSAETALAVYSAPQGLEPYLAKIKQELDAFVPDVSTKKGRDAIASIAYKVAKGKTALDNIGKDLVADLKDVPKKIDAERRRMRDQLDQWKDEVRAPLTAWENAEAERIAAHKSGIERFLSASILLSDCDSDYLQAQISMVNQISVNETWQEFEAEAHREKAKALEILNAALVARQKYEAEQAELAKLRAEAAAREQQDREERIAEEAAEREKQAAEAAAIAEREAVARREADVKAAAEKRELELKLQAERAEREKVEAIQREQQAIADAAKREADAVEAEKRRVAAIAEAEAQETKRREADKAHRLTINRAAVAAFVDGGMTEECAKLAVTLIKKSVPAVSINY